MMNRDPFDEIILRRERRERRGGMGERRDEKAGGREKRRGRERGRGR